MKAFNFAKRYLRKSNLLCSILFGISIPFLVFLPIPFFEFEKIWIEKAVLELVIFLVLSIPVGVFIVHKIVKEPYSILPNARFNINLVVYIIAFIITSTLIILLGNFQ